MPVRILQYRHRSQQILGDRAASAQRRLHNAAAKVFHPDMATAVEIGTERNRETIAERITRLDWPRILAALDADGHAALAPILTPAECDDLIAMYDLRERFRSRIDMARLRFGVGEYKYFSLPLPPIAAELRSALYQRVAPLANEWMRALRLKTRFPPEFDQFRERCLRAGLTKPTPLILRYGDGGYNCMHQDLFGEIFFPLQFTVMLSRPGADFSGGEFLLLEQRPRAQSRCEAVTLERGAGIVFATRWRPVMGSRGYYRVNVRHGVSRVRGERRFTLGIIFHDAK
jgi:hypothetical protein